MRPNSTTRLCAAIVGSLLVAACGTTVPLNSQQQQQAVGQGGGDGLGGLSPGGPGGTTGGGLGATTTGGALGGTTGSTGGLTPGGTTGGSVGRGGTGTTGGGFSTTGGTAGANAQGITAKEVYVGFIYDPNAGAVNQAAGAGGVTSGDSKANTEAIIKDINARGGLGGRKLVPVWADFDSTSSQTLDQQFAAVCEKFTTDSPRVFAVDSSGNTSYKNCLSRAGVLMLSNTLPQIGRQEFDRYPGLIEQGYPNVDRLAAYYLDPLVRQKYFTPWDTRAGQASPAAPVKVGILTYDDVVFSRAVNTILTPALRKLGYDPVVARIGQAENAAAISGQAAAVSSAQLTFASQGVTHLIPFESNGGLSTLFLPTARSQGYYPRYGVSSAAAPQALLSAGVADARQYNGAVGFGWLPSVDLPTAANPANGPYSNANRRYCLDVMRKNGITFDSGNAELIALNTCSSLYLLKTVLDTKPATVTLPGTVRLIEALGSAYQKAGGIGQAFASGRRDPLNKVYDFPFGGGRFSYAGPLRTIP